MLLFKFAAKNLEIFIGQHLIFIVPCVKLLAMWHSHTQLDLVFSYQ